MLVPLCTTWALVGGLSVSGHPPNLTEAQHTGMEQNGITSTRHSPGDGNPMSIFGGVCLQLWHLTPSQGPSLSAQAAAELLGSGCAPCGYPALGWDRDGDTPGCPG